MKIFMKMTWYGFILWLIGFILGFLFWPLHESRFMLFKTIMIVTSTLAGMVLINLYFRNVHEKFVFTSVKLALIWLVINWILDLIFLVGMFKGPLSDYIIEVGLRYLNIPVIVIGVGMLLQKKVSQP